MMNPRIRWVLSSLVLAACGPRYHSTVPIPGRQASADSVIRANAIHLLSRTTYGARPADIEGLITTGGDRFLDQQLDPRLPDSSGAGRVRAYDVIASPGDLEVAYEEYQRLGAEFGPINNRVVRGMICAPDTSLERLENGVSRLTADAIRARQQLIDRRTNQLVAQYRQATILRGIFSQRQLYEILVDFWTNHFNVFVGKASERFLLPAYIESTIRPRALGKFQDLLVATAQSPAMLIYLDNAQSVARGSARPRPPGPVKRFGVPAPPPERCKLAPPPPPLPPPVPTPRPARPQAAINRPTSGLNENYGRELLELHTLGVDGGYTQHDVIEVARIFTGWSVEPGAAEPRFVFNDWAHDHGAKVVLGHRFPAGHGMDEGIALLGFLAHRPATMRHVSSKLCARLVNDRPPQECVTTAMHAWKESDGDIAEVVKAILHSQSFWAPENRGVKVKTPLEFVLSAIRVVGGEPDTTVAVSQLVARLGEPLFEQIAPTGYPETSDAWVNAGALLQRFNVAISLASGTLGGVRVQLDQLAPKTADPDRLVRVVDSVVFNGHASSHTLNTIASRARDVPPGANPRDFVVALALGSPEFERR
jgi:uncharacterized protein (DUF1800 family)